MRIILSPTKKMHVNTDDFAVRNLPRLLERTEVILAWLHEQSPDQLQTLWKCNDSILQQNLERLDGMDLYNALTPAIMAYEGIAFQYMAPEVLESEQLEYLETHLRILSAFYGVLRPFDGVTPYRLEMQAKASIDGCRDLYAFWDRQLYDAVRDESGIFVNLASKEYSKCIRSCLRPDDRMIDITFCEQVKGKLVSKGTYAKMARGEMVRFMAENRIEDPAEMQQFNRLGYFFRADLSDEAEYIFERRV